MIMCLPTTLPLITAMYYRESSCNISNKTWTQPFSLTFTSKIKIFSFYKIYHSTNQNSLKNDNTKAQKCLPLKASFYFKTPVYQSYLSYYSGFQFISFQTSNCSICVFTPTAVKLHNNGRLKDSQIHIQYSTAFMLKNLPPFISKFTFQINQSASYPTLFLREIQKNLLCNLTVAIKMLYCIK